ncbi:serine protease grass-like [Drosophila willistoni]|uniref:serine protease grass-like n=1 Tax=Drosophila willistoni TaxID=7260 RepID=UPI001F07286E|nr:serine protease grass-like [Drosophila willistoni]
MLVKNILLLALSYLLAVTAVSAGRGKYCRALRGRPGTCLPIEECESLRRLNRDQSVPFALRVSLLRPSVCPGPGSDGTFCCNDETKYEGIQKLNQTDTCGIYNVAKGNTGEDLQVDAMPWMALLIYEDPAKKTSSLGINGCAGTLITEKFVLTAAHCLFLNGIELKRVRLGNWIHCDGDNCESRYINFDIEKTIVHERYENTSDIGNIALLKLAETVEFKPYVRPICLPFDNNLQDKAKRNRIYHTIGFGQTENSQLTNNLMMTPVLGASFFDCDSNKPLLCVKDSRICVANIGSPVMNTYLVNGVHRAVQVGIVSNFKGACGTEKLITSTELAQYIPWISHKIVDE